MSRRWPPQAVWLLATGTLGMFIVPALGRFSGLGSAAGGVFAALPFAALLYAQVILINGGRVALPPLTTRILPFAMWSGILLVSVARSNNPAHAGLNGLFLVLMWAAILGAVVLLATQLTTCSSSERETILLAASLALPSYILLNVLLHVAGVANPNPLLVDHPEGSLGALLGLRVNRTLLPLARGINNFGVLAGLSLCLSLAVLLATRTAVWLRVVCCLLVAGALWGLVLVDSRGPLLFGALSGVVVPLLQKARLGRLTRWLAPAAPLLPVILLLGLAALARSPLARSVSRRPGDLTSATGRLFIWGVAGAKLIQHPSASDVVGYGQYGAKGAGVVNAWARSFVGFEADPMLTSTHNVSLQLVYDVGYLGLVLVLWIIWWALGRLHHDRTEDNDVSTTAFTGTIVFLVLAGTTEATISVIFIEPLIVLSLVLAVIGCPLNRDPDADAGTGG
jgi:hypothetical protein